MKTYRFLLVFSIIIFNSILSWSHNLFEQASALLEIGMNLASAEIPEAGIVLNSDSPVFYPISSKTAFKAGFSCAFLLETEINPFRWDFIGLTIRTAYSLRLLQLQSLATNGSQYEYNFLAIGNNLSWSLGPRFRLSEKYFVGTGLGGQYLFAGCYSANNEKYTFNSNLNGHTFNLYLEGGGYIDLKSNLKIPIKGIFTYDVSTASEIIMDFRISSGISWFPNI